MSATNSLGPRPWAKARDLPGPCGGGDLHGSHGLIRTKSRTLRLSKKKKKLMISISLSYSTTNPSQNRLVSLLSDPLFLDKSIYFMSIYRMFYDSIFYSSLFMLSSIPNLLSFPLFFFFFGGIWTYFGCWCLKASNQIFLQANGQKNFFFFFSGHWLHGPLDSFPCLKHYRFCVLGHAQQTVKMSFQRGVVHMSQII